MIEVVNKYHLSEEEQRECIYIGRGSPLGNPFKVKPWGPYERGETLGLYRGWLLHEAKTNPDVKRALNDIWRRAKNGEKVRLLCFCKPRACHGDVIAEVVASKLPADATTRL